MICNGTRDLYSRLLFVYVTIGAIFKLSTAVAAARIITSRQDGSRGLNQDTWRRVAGPDFPHHSGNFLNGLLPSRAQHMRQRTGVDPETLSSRETDNHPSAVRSRYRQAVSGDGRLPFRPSVIKLQSYRGGERTAGSFYDRLQNREHAAGTSWHIAGNGRLPLNAMPGGHTDQPGGLVHAETGGGYYSSGYLPIVWKPSKRPQDTESGTDRQSELSPHSPDLTPVLTQGSRFLSGPVSSTGIHNGENYISQDSEPTNEHDSRTMSGANMATGPQTAAHPGIDRGHLHFSSPPPSPKMGPPPSSSAHSRQVAGLVGEKPASMNHHSYLFRTPTSIGSDTPIKIKGDAQHVLTGINASPAIWSQQNYPFLQLHNDHSSNVNRLQLPNEDPSNEAHLASNNGKLLHQNTNVFPHRHQTYSHQTTQSYKNPLHMRPYSERGATMETSLPVQFVNSHYSLVSDKPEAKGMVAVAQLGGYTMDSKPGRSYKNNFLPRAFEHKPQKQVVGKGMFYPTSTYRGVSSHKYSFGKAMDYSNKTAHSHSSGYQRFGERYSTTAPNIHSSAEYARPIAVVYVAMAPVLMGSSGALQGTISKQSAYAPAVRGWLTKSPSSAATPEDVARSEPVSPPETFKTGIQGRAPTAGANSIQRKINSYESVYRSDGTVKREGVIASATSINVAGEAGMPNLRPNSSGPANRRIWQPKSGMIKSRYKPFSAMRKQKLSTTLQEVTAKYIVKINSEGITRRTPSVRTPLKGGITESLIVNMSIPEEGVIQLFKTSPQNEILGNGAEQSITAHPLLRKSSSGTFRDLALPTESTPTIQRKDYPKPFQMVAQLFKKNTPSHGVVRGKRVKGKHVTSQTPIMSAKSSLSYGAANTTIVGLPERPLRIESITYADIVGSTSFSSVRAASTQKDKMEAKELVFNFSATVKQEEPYLGRVWPPEEEAARALAGRPQEDILDGESIDAEGDLGNFSSAILLFGNEHGLPLKSVVEPVDVNTNVGREHSGRRQEVITMSDHFLDVEGSGILNPAHVLLTEQTTNSEHPDTLIDDRMEQEYVNISK